MSNPIESLVIVDTETTGLDPTTASTIEVAGVIYSVAHRTVIESFATLACNPTNEAEAINRIPAAALGVARSARHAWNRLNDLIDAACGPAAFMAHRAEFDRGFIAAGSPELAARLPWVCSKFDVEWPRSKVGSSCVEMALAHGVPVASAHRALTDCMLIAGTLASVQAEGHDLAAMIAKAMRPKAKFVVAETGFSEARNALAKAAHFRWEKPYWIRTMAIEDAASLPFKVRQLQSPDDARNAST